MREPMVRSGVDISLCFMIDRTYVAIDLKSFYASVECVERGLNPLTTNLVVADLSRTEKTICLAVSPSLKAYGIPGRPRLFEVVQKIAEINRERARRAGVQKLTEKSCFARELSARPDLAVDYVVAPPQMAKYIEISTKIYSVYLKYVSRDDIFVYSIDEVFIDVTHYLNTYQVSAHDLTMRMIRDVLRQTGVTATAGIGTNLYLAKIAMDIEAKHKEADADGVRIAELNELTYRKLLWTHRPITDFWRVGAGYQSRLAAMGLYTMGDIARASLTRQDELYAVFGVNAELLIDHAWGYEPTCIADIKSYKPSAHSLGSGQVLQEPYSVSDARIVVFEMTDALALEMVSKNVKSAQLVLTVGYDIESLIRPEIRSRYRGEIVDDGYGRKIPKSAHGTIHLDRPTSSSKALTQAMLRLYDRIINPVLLVRRVALTAILMQDDLVRGEQESEPDLFAGMEPEQTSAVVRELEREDKRQKAILALQKRFGKNVLLKGVSYTGNATAKKRNSEIGGHKA